MKLDFERLCLFFLPDNSQCRKRASHVGEDETKMQRWLCEEHKNADPKTITIRQWWKIFDTVVEEENHQRVVNALREDSDG